jgi:dihydrofolate reductase
MFVFLLPVWTQAPEAPGRQIPARIVVDICINNRTPMHIRPDRGDAGELRPVPPDKLDCARLGRPGKESLMSKIIYSSICSLDGFIADSTGNFQWAAPDEDVHAFINDLERPIGTYLYGRRMYEVMAFWEDLPDPDQQSAAMRDFASIWKAADKIVFSTSLASVATPKTTLERRFDSDHLRRLKATSDHDLTVGGPDLAAHAIRAGLVDEYQVFLAPVVIGRGTKSLPDDCRIDLTLIDERRFTSGFMFLRYENRSAPITST